MTLTDGHIEAQKRLRDTAVRTVETRWESLPAYNEPDAEAFVAAVVPAMLVAQRASAVLTSAYVARAIGRRVPPPDLARVVGAAVRAGTDPREVYRRPFVTVWSALKRDGDQPAAIAAGLARATALARTDVQLTMRATLQEAQTASGGVIRGYRRVADAGACAFCSTIDGAYVKSADAMPLHPGCGCGLEPIMDERVTASAVPETVAVHEHGELGPVLGSPDHQFTQL